MKDLKIKVGTYKQGVRANGGYGHYTTMDVDITLDMLAPEFQKVINNYLNIPG